MLAHSMHPAGFQLSIQLAICLSACMHACKHACMKGYDAAGCLRPAGSGGGLGCSVHLLRRQLANTSLEMTSSFFWSSPCAGATEDGPV